jgi:hypothetical protein
VSTHTPLQVVARVKHLVLLLFFSVIARIALVSPCGLAGLLEVVFGQD